MNYEGHEEAHGKENHASHLLRHAVAEGSYAIEALEADHANRPHIYLGRDARVVSEALRWEVPVRAGPLQCQRQ